MNINISIICALTDLTLSPFYQELQVALGSTIEQALQIANLTDFITKINNNSLKVGVWGTVCPITQLLKNNDRIEIYKTLLNNSQELWHKRKTNALCNN